MKKISAYVFALVGILLMVACNNQGLKKTKSGLLYKIISDQKNPLVKKGQFIKINFKQKLRDSVLFSSENSMPAYVKIDTASPTSYSPLEIFPLLRKGDSAVVVQTGDSIQKKSGQPLPPFIKKRDKIVLTLKVVDVFDSQDLVEKDRQIALDTFHARETREVEDYLTKNHIAAQKTEKGTFVLISNPGEGAAVDSGKEVSVLYTGKLFPSGKVFETNMSPGKQPIKFVIGKRQIIPGWDDGLRMFKKGGKGTLYLPAFLAYDAQPGPGKTPNENLIFDVQIVDVNDAPAEQPMMRMPQRALPGKTLPKAPAKTK